VLGLTLAELIMLVLFVLLLALASLMLRSDREKIALNDALKQTEEKIERTRREYAALADILAKLDDPAASREQKLHQLFEELEKSKTQFDTAQQEIASLARLVTDLESENGQLNAELQAAESTKAELEETVAQQAADLEAIAGIKPGETTQSIARALSAQHQLAQAIAGPSGEPSFDAAFDLTAALSSAITSLPPPIDPPALAADLKRFPGVKQELDSANRELDELRRRNRWYQESLGGRGVEMPSCWIAKSGKPEYIFDVTLGGQGLMIRTTELPHRVKDRGQLPVVTIADTGWVQPSQFLAATRPLFDLSVKEECRFFVRVIDQTPSHDKALYIKRLQTVEQHFYKFLVGNREL
jgi:septal ring factor EnvC (AmiA/AmiB activator)